jgi:ABC-type branched-subunit amino acid transport system ATPase component
MNLPIILNMESKLLLIDEPAEGLVPAFADFIQNVLKNFKAKLA